VIRALGKRMIGDVLEIARRLAEAKVLAEKVGGHAYWLRWIDQEFSWGEQTARNFLNVRSFGEKLSVKFTDLNLADLSLPVSGLYALAAPNTPDEAREAVIERAQNGERLSVKDVKNLIDEERKKQATETAERLAAREAEIRAEYVPESWTRKPPPEPATERSYYLQFLRTKLHPVAESLWCPMTAEEFASLVKSIKAHGQRDPIILVEHQGEWVILDGICREIACGIAGLEPKYRKTEVADPCGFWISTNIQRVHLTKGQKAMRNAILTEPDADDGAYTVAARYVLARCKPFADAVINGSMSLRDAYDKLVDDAWRMQHGSVDQDDDD
jgi:hypothetical protein